MVGYEIDTIIETFISEMETRSARTNKCKNLQSF